MTPYTHTDTLADSQFDGPSAVALDEARDRLLVVNTLGGTVTAVDLGGASPSFTSVGTPGTDATSEGLSFPTAAVVDANGNLLVLDTGNEQLDRYLLASDGSYSYDDGFLGGDRGRFDGVSLSNPSGLARDGATVYVLDAGNHRIVTLDLSTGTTATTLSDSRWGDAVDVAVHAPDTLYVSDAGTHRVYRYRNGSADGTLGSYGTASGSFREPRGLTVDDGGTLFVVDEGNGRLQQFDDMGADLGTVDAQTTFGSPRDVAVDSTGRLFVADASRDAVHVFEPGAASVVGPAIDLSKTVLDFGEVETGFGLDLVVTVANPGTETLAVSAVESDDDAFVPQARQFDVPAGAEHDLVVRFTPEAVGIATGVLTLQSDAATTPTQSILAEGRGTLPAPVDVVLVLDRSGSMQQSTGPRTKLDALAEATALFVDLLRPEVGDRLGVVAFDNTIETVAPLVAVSDTTGTTRAAIKSSVAALRPGRETSIGGGLERARQLFEDAPARPAATADARKILVLVSDGMENAAPYVAGGDPDDRIDLDAFAGVSMYTLGLGHGAEVDLEVLSDLADEFAGRFHLTEDRWLTLPKFFVEVLGDALGEYVALDPEYRLEGDEPTHLTTTLSRADRNATVVVYWTDPDDDLTVTLRTPDGGVLAGSSSLDGVTHRRGRTYVSYRLDLPLSTVGGPVHEGKWEVVVDRSGGGDRTVTFGASVLVRSAIGIDCSLDREAPFTGVEGLFTTALTAYGRPVELDAVTLTVDAPAFSRGDLLASLADVETGGVDEAVEVLSERFRAALDSPLGANRRRVDDFPARDRFVERFERLLREDDDMRSLVEDGVSERADTSSDYRPAVDAGRLVRALEHDDRFDARRQHTLAIADFERLDEPRYQVVVPETSLEGAYQFRVVTTAVVDGLELRRECARTITALSRPVPAETDVRVVETVERPDGFVEYTLDVVPRDGVGNRIGPGRSPRVHARAAEGRVSAVDDRGDGSYRVTTTLPAFSSMPSIDSLTERGLSAANVETLRAAGLEDGATLSVVDRATLEAAGVGGADAVGIQHVVSAARREARIDDAVVEFDIADASVVVNLHDILNDLGLDYANTDTEPRPRIVGVE
jgi:sugar lactone lactonase YvrE/Mg-chelatase subunit ChlD